MLCSKGGFKALKSIITIKFQHSSSFLSFFLLLLAFLFDSLLICLFSVPLLFIFLSHLPSLYFGPLTYRQVSGIREKTGVLREVLELCWKSCLKTRRCKLSIKLCSRQSKTNLQQLLYSFHEYSRCRPSVSLQV